MTYTLKGKCTDCGCVTTVEEVEGTMNGFFTCPICQEQVLCIATEE